MGVIKMGKNEKGQRPGGPYGAIQGGAFLRTAGGQK